MFPPAILVNKVDIQADAHHVIFTCAEIQTLPDGSEGVTEIRVRLLMPWTVAVLWARHLAVALQHRPEDRPFPEL